MNVFPIGAQIFFIRFLMSFQRLKVGLVTAVIRYHATNGSTVRGV
jgi:hypothetical protein